jgi:hypothetical protein
MIALLDKFTGHVDKGGVSSFQIGRQQGKDTVVGRIPVESLECSGKATAVKLQVTDIMFACTFTGGTAAFEDHFMFTFSGNHPVHFEKFDRKERYFIQGIYTVRLYAEVIEIGFINGIFSCLEPENFQGQFMEFFFGTDIEDPVCRNLTHSVKLQKETAKIFLAMEFVDDSSERN